MLSLKIKKRTIQELLTYYVVLMTMSFPFLTQVLSLTPMLKYTIDLAIIVLAILYLTKKSPLARECKILAKWIGILILYCSFAYILNYQSIFYYIWGARNTFRYFVYFLVCIAFIKVRDVDVLVNRLIAVYYFNAFIVFFQYFILGYKQDLLGGLFGVQRGCNSGLNIYGIIVVSIVVVKYLNKKTSIWNCAFVCILSIIIAAFAELKFFFVEFAVVIILASLITKFSFKKLWIIIGSILLIIIGSIALGKIFPEFAASMSFRGLLEIGLSEKGYTSSGDINRLTFYTFITNRFLNHPAKLILGLGLGNCNYADGWSFVTSPFYLTYGSLHYTWLTTAMVFLETGLVGMFLYFGFFILVFRKLDVRKYDDEHVYIVQSAKIVSLLSILICIYNSSLQMDCGFLIFFFLALPFVQI